MLFQKHFLSWSFHSIERLTVIEWVGPSLAVYICLYLLTKLILCLHGQVQHNIINLYQTSLYTGLLSKKVLGLTELLSKVHFFFIASAILSKSITYKNLYFQKLKEIISSISVSPKKESYIYLNLCTKKKYYFIVLKILKWFKKLNLLSWQLLLIGLFWF